jgi:hypothetical protein
MDRNLDIENFERLLKDRSDEFKMYPEKRVWHSIYNNIHPAKKWPSVATSITLIAILLMTGYFNTNTKNTNPQVSSSHISSKTPSSNFIIAPYNPFLKIKQLNQIQSAPFAENFTLNNSDNLFNNNKKEPLLLPAADPGLISGQWYSDKFSSGNHNKITRDTGDKFNQAEQIFLARNESISIVPIKNDVAFTTRRIHQPPVSINQNDLIASTVPDSKKQITNSPIENSIGEKISKIEDLNEVSNNATDYQNEKIFATKTASLEKTENILVLSEEEKVWIENYALYNRPAPKKWAGKLGRQIYFTPSVVYRQLKNTVSAGQGNINQDIIQHPSYGLEVGTGINYSLLKRVKIKIGLQLNFTKYNTEAYTNSHPVATTITFVSPVTGQPYPAYRSTSFSNFDGITSIKLHNETFQISLPMGADVKIAGNDNLQWNIGATLQPTYVIGGKSYLLSSDKRNFIKETSLLNRWNLNAGFETFLSYKTDNGFTVQFGPQFRTQLFTTNTKQYIIQEKLNNYGFKFGITKLIK